MSDPAGNQTDRSQPRRISRIADRPSKNRPSKNRPSKNLKEDEATATELRSFLSGLQRHLRRTCRSACRRSSKGRSRGRFFGRRRTHERIPLVGVASEC